jgi:hypothetical protein
LSVLTACFGLLCKSDGHLATSREALLAPAEVPWRVPSLEVPEVAGTASPTWVLRYEAPQLFVDRLRQGTPWNPPRLIRPYGQRRWRSHHADRRSRNALPPTR